MKQGNPPSPVFPNQRPPSSLGRSLVAWMGAGTLLVLLLIGLSATYVAFETELANWQARLGDESRASAKSLAAFLQATKDELALVGLLDPTYLHNQPQVLASFQKHNSALIDLLRTDASGTVIASANQDKPLLAGTQAISQTNWFRAAAAGQSALQVIQSSPAGESYLVVAVPASDGGVVVGRLPLDTLQGTVRSLDLGPSGSAMIIDSDGRILADTDPLLVFGTVNSGAPPEIGPLPSSGDARVASYRDTTGQDMLAAFASVSGTGWTMVAQVSHAQVFAASRNLLLTLAAALLGLALIGSLFLRHLLTRLVFRPIQQLRAGVERIGRGDLGHSIDVVRRDEIGMVAEAVNAMAKRLQERDQEIAVRTQALRASETRLRRITDSMQDMISEIDPQGNILYVSPSHCQVLGYTPEQLIGRSALEHLHPDDRALAIAALDETVASRTNLGPAVYRYQHSDGHYLWLESIANLVLDSQGQLTGIVLCSRDITRRREMEAALRQHNEYLSALYATAMALMERLDVKDVLQAIVESAAKLMDTPDGYIHLQMPGQTEIETVVGLGIHSEYVGHRRRIDKGLDGEVWQSGQAIAIDDYDIWEGREKDLALNKFHAAVGVPLRSGSQVVGVLGLSYREPGRTFGKVEVDQLAGFAQFASIALDNARLYAAAQQELAERKRAQEALRQLNQELEQHVAERTSALRQSEERLRAIMDSAKDAIVAADSSGKMILWNQGAETMFGYTADQVLGQPIDLIIPERFRDSMRGTIARWSQTEGGAIRRTFEGTGLKQDGEEFPVETSLAGWSSQGRWFGNAIIRDITDRKRAEETLAHSERYFRSLIENAFDITAIEDSNGMFTYVSPSVERVLGYTPSDVIGRSMLSFVHPDDWVQVQTLFARSVSDGQGPAAPPQVRARHRDGTWRVMEAVAMNCLGDPAIAGIVTNIRDVTERKQAEEKLLQGERRFRALVENSWDLVALLDASGMIQYASPSATAVAGYLPEELVGRDAFEFMPPEEVSVVKPLFESLIQQPGEAVTLTTRLLHHDGHYRWTDLMAKNLLLEPTIQAVVVHIHDITDRKVAELQAQKRDAHLNALSQMGLAVTMSLDLEVVLNQIVHELMPLLEGAEGVSILLREENELFFAAVEGSGTDTLLGLRMPCDVGVAGTVVQTGEPQRVTSNLEEDKIYREVEGITGFHTQSLLAVPLILAGESIGVLEAVHRHPEAFSDDDLHLLEDAAKWASTTIGNARNYQDLKRRLEEDQALSLIGQALNETLELEKILQLITRSAQQIVPSVEKAVIHLYDETRKALYPVAAAGSVRPEDGTLHMRLGEGIAGRVMEQAAAINIADVPKDPRYLHADGAGIPRSLLVAPIQSRTLRSGTISIESALPNAFSAKDESLLTRLGTLASIAIKNASLYHGEREQRALAEALRETASALGSTLDFDAVLDSILDNVGRVIRYDLAAILLIEQPTGFVKVVRCLASDPRLADTVRDFRMHLSQIPNFQIILQTGDSQVIPDVREWPQWVDVPATRWIASHIGIPIRLRDQIIGFLNLESTTPGFYADEHIARLQSFAAQAATALGNAKLYQELQDALKQEQTTRSQLIQSGKLAALGRMAASVAHEFNNPLQTIKNCLYLLQPQCVETEDAEFMSIAISETERLSRLVEQLRSAYHPGSPEDMRPLKLCSVLEHTCALIMPHLKENRVNYEFESPPSELAVTGVADQLKQVFLNIALNAVDAMKPSGGKLSITSWVDASAKRVAVAISDTGRGISEEDMGHLFDPFFTTKETGMGLGLAITFDIVQKHNGQIEVTSALGQGSTFTVWLPLSES